MSQAEPRAHAARRRPIIAVAAAAAAVALAVGPTASHASTLADGAPASPTRPMSAPTTTLPPLDQPVSTNDFLDLGRDLSDCVGLNPLPDCGRKPTAPGDRGSPMQFTIAGLMVAGLGVIGWRIVRSTRSRDTAGS